MWQYGCAKYTFACNHFAMNPWSANSLPLSGVMVLHRALWGHSRSTIAWPTRALVRLGKLPAMRPQWTFATGQLDQLDLLDLLDLWAPCV